MGSYVGIDYSTRKVSAARLRPGHEEPYVLSYSAPKAATGITATKLVMDIFSGWCLTSLVLDADVYIESPIMGRMLNAQTAIGMGIAAGALMQASTMYGAASVEFVSPSFWKKQVTGNGAMDKVGVGEWLAAAQPELADYCHNDDEQDAMCLALLCQQVVGAGSSD